MPLLGDEEEFPTSSSSDAERTSSEPPLSSDSPEDTSDSQPRPGNSEEPLLPDDDDFDPRCRQDFHGLLYLGALTTEVDVYGHKFEMRTLTTDEQLQIGLFLREYEGSVIQGKAYATALVASSVVSVDGKELPKPFQAEKGDTPLRHKVKIVAKWYPQVVDILYNEYLILEARTNKVFAALGKELG
jgi:hypothetical protein